MTRNERALEVLAGLRPQAYGGTRPEKVGNPIVEPWWQGIRVLAAVDGASVELRDPNGEVFEQRPEIGTALAEAVRDVAVVIDGYLTKEIVRTTADLMPADDIPRMGTLIGQSMTGVRRNRAREATEELERQREAETFGPEDAVALVATDLLWLDGESLLDVPLLERKRLLETVIEESDLIRISTFVRPPEGNWVASWRRLGLRGLSYREANSRYHPGEQRSEWVTAPMPRR